jgi:signal transduction histidine kinase
VSVVTAISTAARGGAASRAASPSLATASDLPGAAGRPAADNLLDASDPPSNGELPAATELPGTGGRPTAGSLPGGSDSPRTGELSDTGDLPAGREPADAGLLCPNELPDGLIVADSNGTVVIFNHAAERLTGVAADQVLGKPLRSALPLFDGDGRCWWGLSRPYDGLSIRSRHPERSLFLVDGGEVLVTIGYVRGPRNGDPRQRGEVQRLTITLRSAAAQARLERTRADLVSTVAHELRSPLTSVKGFTATLLDKWPRFTDDQKRMMLETVNADADRVTRLITELLDVSRIEAGRIAVHRELVDVAARTAKLVAARVASGEPASKFKIDVIGELPETWLDADKVDQILANLIENAVKHGAGTVTTVIESALVHGTPGIAVSVRDEGAGIAPEFAPRVFRQFWRAKRRGGAGLGLFIVKGLVEAHGGVINVAQAPGGGAEFRFSMPAGTPDHE